MAANRSPMPPSRMGTSKSRKYAPPKTSGKQSKPKINEVSYKFSDLGRFGPQYRKKGLDDRGSSRQDAQMHLDEAISELADALGVEESILTDVLRANRLLKVIGEPADAEPASFDPKVYATLAALDILRSAGVPETEVPADFTEGLTERIAALELTARARLEELKQG